MQTIVNVGKCLFAFFVGFLLIFKADDFATNFGLSEVGKISILALACVPAILLYLLLSGNLRSNISVLIKPVPQKIWGWRFLSATLLFLGILIYFWDRSEVFVLFPFCDNLVCFFAIFVFLTKGISPEDRDC